MKNKNIGLLIISLICPIIGIILYILYKKDKNKSSYILKGTIFGLCIYSVFVLYFSTHSTDYFERDVERWQRDVRAGNTVVTVIGASYCEHCQAYKPVINVLANKHHINLYFYEIDTLSEEDQNKLTNTFPIGDYTGNVPYTFIMRNGEFVASNEGYGEELAIVNFFIENGIIKN